MTTACYYHPACLGHSPREDSSETPDRLRYIVDALHGEKFKALLWPEVRRAKLSDLALVHSPQYIDFVFESVPMEGHRDIEIEDIVSDYDDGEITSLSPLSGEAVLYAVGAVLGAVDDVMSGKIANAYCAVRPPGHHATQDRAMGFCVFNNVAIGARHAQKKHGAKRVAIVDFDLHHGNGTQDIFEKDASVFYSSIHQLPMWPESGHEHEVGVGNLNNISVPPDCPRDLWMQRWNDVILRRLEKEDFDLLFVSAGFDAHNGDPKSSQPLTTEDYFNMAMALRRIAEKKCGGRVIAVQEGGYHLQNTADSAAALVEAFMRGDSR